MKSNDFAKASEWLSLDFEGFCPHRVNGIEALNRTLKYWQRKALKKAQHDNILSFYVFIGQAVLVIL
ncbi:hypothetical protein BOO92_03570 [Vibrio navarrensis]|nr:hypothetical protein [Vibrio navarrensis]